jgi:methyl-accepting chemotaxis protein
MQSLTTRLALFLAAILAITALLLTTFMYTSMRKEMLSELEREVNAVSEQQKNTIANWLADKRRIATAMAPAVFDADARTQLKRAAAAGGFTNSYVSFMGPAVVQSADAVNGPDFDATARPWYKAAMAKGALVVTNPFMSVSDRKLVVSVALPVERNGQTAAVFSSNLLLEEVVSGVLGVKLVGDTHAFLLGKDGTLIAHRKADAVLKPATGLMPELTPDRVSALAASGELVETTVDGKAGFVTLRAIPDSDWTLGLVVDRNAALAPLHVLLVMLIGGTVVIVLVSVVLAVLGIRRLLAGLASLRDAMLEIAQGEGDLTVRLPVVSRDEVGQAAGAFNQFLERLHGMFREVRDEADHVRREVGVVAGTASHVAGEFTRQTDELSATAATIEEVTVSIGLIAETVRETEHAMSTADGESERSAESVEELTREISRAAETMSGLSSVVSRLGSRSDEIAGIVGAIKDIADQTNLLALNAAIEAARAGEQGRGFAVVADEVRKLAERTAESTVEIGRMIDSIRSEMTSAVSGMDDAQRIVTSGVGMAEQATQGIRTIRSRVSEVMARVKDISGATSEQASATTEMARRAEQVHAMIQSSSDSLRDTERTLRGVNARADHLGSIVGRFRL